MAGSVNKVILVGNLGRDPEIRAMQSGDRVANLSIATSDTWTDKSSGERREKTEWHRVVVFNQNQINFIEKYASKGTKVYVEGALETRKYTDQSGAEKYTTEVVVKNFKGEVNLLDRGGSSAGPSDAGDAPYSGGQSSGSFSARDDLEDDIPF